MPGKVAPRKGGGGRNVGDGGDAAGCRTRGGKKGGNQAGGQTERRVKGEGAGLPVDAGVVADEPGEAQDQGEVRKADQLKGNVLCMGAMDSDAGWVEVGDRRGRTAINEFDRDRMGVGGGCQLMGG